MSASREKKNRQNKPEVVTAEAPKKGMSKCLKRTLTVIVAIIIVAAIVFLGMVSTGFFQKHSTAAVVNGHKLSPAMMNYYYGEAYSSLQEYMTFDTEVPLSEQASYFEGQTMEEYVMNYALDIASNKYTMYDAAVEAGFELDEDGVAEIDYEMQMMDLYAAYYGLSDGAAMLVNQYGAGSTKESYRKYLEVSKTVDAYANSIMEDFTYTAEDLNAYYAENSNDLDSVSFRQFSVTPDTLHVEADEAGLLACEEAANTVAAAAENGEEAFLEAIMAVIPEDHAAEYDADTTTLRSGTKYASLAELYKEWLIDETRQEGDVEVFKNEENGYIVLYFIAHDDNNYLTPNVRHILIAPSDSSDEAAKAEAKAKAEEILATYQAGEQTEDAFVELVMEHSADNTENGGLYENITRGQMVESFENWCYDEARQVGDVDIVESDYGYHIMYFVGQGRSYLDLTIENLLRQEDYLAWRDELIAANEAESFFTSTRWMMKL